MRTVCTWRGKTEFSSKLGRHEVSIDAKPPVGGDAGPSPKQLVLAGLATCTGIDVISILRKARQLPTAFEVDAEAPLTTGYPSMFARVDLLFRVTGEVDPAVLADAVRRSQTLYCGVSAMISRACPIAWRVELNGAAIAEGAADFKVSS